MQSVNNLEHRTQYKSLSKSLTLLAADVPTTVGADWIVGRAGYTIFCQHLRVSVTTLAAQALVFQDDANTPKVLATLPASATAGDVHELIESEEGVPLTEGKNLDITGAAGVAGTIDFIGYLRPTGTMTPAGI